ncbi:MAG: hypothetical protein ACUVXA_10465 [Candidatus Jordarchaeum sp.]|uniref:hypothetical protein n=1 Tax=Candidatus Jordarchaeum sp. TaxID=2823881 RepID=UPI0040492F6A
MATTKRKIYKVLKWIAIIAGLGSAFLGFILGVNSAQALNNIGSLNWQISIYPDAPKALYYDGIGYELNLIGIIQVSYPNGTVIDSKADYVLYPYELTMPLKTSDPVQLLLGLYGNTFFLDFTPNVTTSFRPLVITGVFIIWFTLTIPGFNFVVTPVTVFYQSPQIF